MPIEKDFSWLERVGIEVPDKLEGLELKKIIELKEAVKQEIDRLIGRDVIIPSSRDGTIYFDWNVDSILKPDDKELLMPKFRTLVEQYNRLTVEINKRSN